MIEHIKDYYVTDNKTVSDDDIREALKIANETGEIIRLIWNGPGWQWYASEINAYKLIVRPGDDFNELKEQTPKIYGI